MKGEGCQGFTLAEVVIAIAVISVIAVIYMGSNLGYQARTRDIERANDTMVISKELERNYRMQAAITGPSYPSTAIGSSGLVNLVNDSESTTSPGKNGTSIVIASSANAQYPTIDQYIYQPFDSNDNLCTAVPCTRYVIYYKTESGDQSIKKINSMRQQ